MNKKSYGEFRFTLLLVVLLMMINVNCDSQSSDAQKLSALQQALKAGVITQEEYDAKVQALKGTQAVSGKAPAGANSLGGRTKTWMVVDTMLNIPAFKVTVPANWTFEGAVLRSACGDGLAFFTYRAYSPDKLTGFQWLPKVEWYYASDPSVLKAMGPSVCNYHEPARAADVAAKIASDLRPGAEVMGLPAPTRVEAERLRAARQQMGATPGQANRPASNFQPKWDTDLQDVKIRYTFNGHPVEEWLTVFLTTTETILPGVGPRLQATRARVVHTAVNVSAIRAPAGKLEATVAAVQQLPLTEATPEWTQAQVALIKQQGAQTMAMLQRSADNLKMERDQFAAQMQQSYDQYHAWQQQRQAANLSKFQADMRRKDGQTQNFIDYIDNQQYYLNPATGGTQTIKNEPGINTYYGETPQGGWVPLVPISH